MPVQDPWGQGELRGVFCRPRHFFSGFILRQLCRRCSTTCFLEYHFFTHSPRGEVGGGGVVFSPVWFFLQCGFSPVWFFSCLVWLGHLFLQVLRLCLTSCLRCLLHPVSPFCFCPHSLPPASSPPPLLTLVFSPAVSSVPGTAAPRYSPTKTHMHFESLVKNIHCRWRRPGLLPPGSLTPALRVYRQDLT